jgi:hypothetical protein
MWKPLPVQWNLTFHLNKMSLITEVLETVYENQYTVIVRYSRYNISLAVKKIILDVKACTVMGLKLFYYQIFCPKDYSNKHNKKHRNILL